MRETAGSTTMPVATPKSPTGSCQRRNAVVRAVTEPFWRSRANPVLMKMVNCVTPEASTEGSISPQILRTRGSFHWKLGFQRKPVLLSLGSCTAIWAMPPMVTPQAKPYKALGPKDGSMKYPISRPSRMEVTLKAAEASMGSPKTPTMFSAPMMRADREANPMKGHMMRLRSVANNCSARE